METTTIILSILTALLGGTNIFQLFFLHADRRKRGAEAVQAEITSQQMIIDGNVQEIKRLQERLEIYERRVEELQNLVIELREELGKLKE